MGTSEEILLRVMVKGDTIVPGAIRFELMSENDVQFYYQATIKEENFRQIQIANDLMIEYDTFFATFQKLLQDCLDRPHSHRVTFTLDDDDGNADFEVEDGDGALTQAKLPLVCATLVGAGGPPCCRAGGALHQRSHVWLV